MMSAFVFGKLSSEWFEGRPSAYMGNNNQDDTAESAGTKNPPWLRVERRKICETTQLQLVCAWNTHNANFRSTRILTIHETEK